MALARLEPLVLKPRQAVSSPELRWFAALFMLAVFSALVWVMFMLLGNPFGDWDWVSFAKASRGILKQIPMDRQIEGVVLALALGGHLWYLRRASKHERLHLDQVGMRYESPLPRSLRALHSDWSLQWPQVREIRIVVPKVGLYRYLFMLEIDAGPVKRKLRALHWSGDAGAESLPWRERFFLGFRPARDRESILRQAEQSTVVRYAREAGVKVTTGEPQGIGYSFALESNRHALAAVMLVLLLLGYCVVDFPLNEETYAVDPPLVLFVLAGAIAALASMVWLASADVPRTETLGLSLLLGGAIGFALYPGVLRLNEATDTGGLRACEYRLTEYVVFSPADPDLPVLRFPTDADYWRQFKLGTTHRFELRKGGLGFYQVNMQSVHAKMHEYFIGKR